MKKNQKLQNKRTTQNCVLGLEECVLANIFSLNIHSTQTKYCMETMYTHN